VAVQPDGKLLVAGSSTLGAGKTDFIVVRFLNPQGTGDPSFGSANGGALVDFGGTDFGSAMVLQPDGKILLAGTTDVNGRDEFAAARLLSDGTPDNSFGQGGKAIFDLGGSDHANAMTLQPDGKIIVAGDRITGTSGHNPGRAQDRALPTDPTSTADRSSAAASHGWVAARA
jgi:uncharacterized delta-60 repeat protein